MNRLLAKKISLIMTQEDSILKHKSHLKRINWFSKFNVFNRLKSLMCFLIVSNLLNILSSTQDTKIKSRSWGNFLNKNPSNIPSRYGFLLIFNLRHQSYYLWKYRSNKLITTQDRSLVIIGKNIKSNIVYVTILSRD